MSFEVLLEFWESFDRGCKREPIWTSRDFEFSRRQILHTPTLSSNHSLASEAHGPLGLMFSS